MVGIRKHVCFFGGVGLKPHAPVCKGNRKV